MNRVAVPSVPWAAIPWPAVVVLALTLRVLLFPFAENKQADAPMRALIAERMNADSAAADDPRSFCQFGPLPIEAMRPFMAADPDARRSSRVLSLLAGLLVFWPFFALGRRMLAGVSGAGLALGVAGLGLALSPLHIQLSTTAGSEALYLLLLLATLARLHAAVSEGRRGDYLVAGLLASLAAVTRYDTWLAVPVAMLGALACGPRDRRAVVDVALFGAAAAMLPAAYLIWSWSKTGDPFFFARYITQDHATMAQAVAARFGPVLSRLRQLAIWLVSFAAAMTPLLFAAVPAAARQWRRWSAGTRVVLLTALAPTAAYLANGILLGQFEPLPRFAIGPGAALLPVAASALLSLPLFATARRASLGVTVAAVLIAASALLAAFARPDRIWAGAESIGPLTRLDSEDRGLALYLLQYRRPQEAVFIDTFGYVDAVIAHAARVPAPLTTTLAHTRTPSATLRQSRARTGASWFAYHALSWAKTLPPDWPASKEQRFGGWHLAYVADGAQDAHRHEEGVSAAP
ncbi:MAG: glycosyltransferase family 39 protein [Polyangia bacterium]